MILVKLGEAHQIPGQDDLTFNRTDHNPLYEISLQERINTQDREDRDDKQGHTEGFGRCSCPGCTANRLPALLRGALHRIG